MVGAEDLAEEGPEGHAWGEDTIPPADTLLTQGVLDGGGIDQPGDESGRIMAERIDVATDAVSGRLTQRRPPRR